MYQASNHWGVELIVADRDKRVWLSHLMPPFDPYIEEVNDDRGSYLALRSTAFDGVASSKQVHELAKQLTQTLKEPMSDYVDTDSVSNGAVVEFISNGPPRKHHRIAIEAATMRIRGGAVKLSRVDAQGNVVEPTPSQSPVQLCMHAATLEPKIGSAMRYLEGEPNWVKLYKAYEVLKRMPRGRISKNEIRRFRQTANVEDRHPPDEGFEPHPNPMTLSEGRFLIKQWVSFLKDETLAKNL